MEAPETGVRAFFESLAATWKRNDGAAFASCFTEDGSLINPFGERADGRAALTDMYTGYFRGMLQGTSTTIELTHLRSLADDLALADADQLVYAHDGNAILTLHVVNLLKRDGGSWRLVDSRPYEFSSL